MRDQIQATIITIGDELLIGQVIDTNSAFIAQKLNSIGVQVHQRIAVGDEAQSITNALDTAIEKSQIVIITGGLGPTADDITKPLLNRYFGGKMVLDQHLHGCVTTAIRNDDPNERERVIGELMHVFTERRK